MKVAIFLSLVATAVAAPAQQFVFGTIPIASQQQQAFIPFSSSSFQQPIFYSSGNAPATGFTHISQAPAVFKSGTTDFSGFIPNSVNQHFVYTSGVNAPAVGSSFVYPSIYKGGQTIQTPFVIPQSSASFVPSAITYTAGTAPVAQVASAAVPKVIAETPGSRQIVY